MKMLAGGLLLVAVGLAGGGYYWFELCGRASRLARSGDPDQRLRAVHELWGRRSAAAVEILKRLSADAHTRVAVEATRALGRAGVPAAEAALRRCLRDETRAAVRSAAAAELGHWPDAAAELTALLRAPEPAVRAGAAKGLAMARAREALGPLTDALADADGQVRLWAAAAIGKTIRMPLQFQAHAPPDVRRDQVAAVRATLKSLRAAERQPTESQRPTPR